MATVLLDFNRIQILTPEQNEKVLQELLGARNVWLHRNNWHSAIEIAGPDSGIEDYVHYSTVGATLYMDARDRGWKLYGKLRDMYNRLLWNRLGWLYDTFLEQIQNEIGDAEYDSGLALPGFNIYEFLDAPDDKKHHRCLHYDGQWWWGKRYFTEKYKEVDFRNQLSYTFSIKVPHNGSAIALWNLPEDYHAKARALQEQNWHPVIDRYQTVEYVQEIRRNHVIEDPWKFDLFNENCGELDQYIPYVIPHLEGHSFWYYGMVMHQMILGDSFKKGDYRITFQGHALKCDGVWRLFW
jgi:hypothetical protein